MQGLLDLPTDFRVLLLYFRALSAWERDFLDEGLISLFFRFILAVIVILFVFFLLLIFDVVDDGDPFRLLL